MTPETAWEAGRFDARSGPKRMLFGRMYEDTEIEQAAFTGARRVFCIASAGCTAMALVAQHDVTAVDINPIQLAYAERRAAGGPVRIGAAERVMALGRRLMRLCGWNRRTIETFLALAEPDEQLAYWHRHLSTARFRAATGVLFSTAWLRLIYASPFLDVVPPHFGRVMRARLERGWRTHPNRTNPYARALLLGDFPASPRPTAGGIRFVCADAAAFLEACPAGSFDGFTLSNVLDGASALYRARLLAAVRHAGTPDSVVVLRSFGEPRRVSPTNRATQDRSMLWGVAEALPVRACAG